MFDFKEILVFTKGLENHYIFLLVLICLWLFTSRDDEFSLIKTIIRKSIITFESFLFMVISKDSKGVGQKYAVDADKMAGLPVQKKTIIFIRHGESDWNNVFNKGINPYIFVRLAKALFQELLLIFRMDSIFLDSPLNSEGIEQAIQLRHFLHSSESQAKYDDYLKKYCAILRGEEGTSVIASSTLRRAIATTVLALWPRIENKKEKVYVLSNLQEISRNIDTRSISSSNSVADLPNKRLIPHCSTLINSHQELFDASENFGNKTRSFYGIKRLRSFADWAYKRPENAIIVGGHSLWFKYFFQTFLPSKSTHEAKNKKIMNSGVVSFTLLQAVDSDGSFLYGIDENSIRVIYGGFEKKK